jgi:NAD(P)-dependent dehydrogenase (short-subunit alcohol dehydrogenase family)
VLIARDSSHGALDSVRDAMLRVTVDAHNATAWHGLAPRQVLAVRLDLESDIHSLQRAFGDILSTVGHALEVVVSVAGSVQPTLLLGPDALARVTRDLHVDVLATGERNQSVCILRALVDPT